MNILGNGWSRICRSALTTPGRDIPRWSSPASPTIEQTTTKTIWQPDPKEIIQPRITTGNFMASFGVTQWTQVRFQKDRCPCPRLHRDVTFPKFDDYRKDMCKDPTKTSFGEGDKKKGWTPAVGCFAVVAGMYALKTELLHLASYMSAAADVLAMATIEVDISKIQPGACSSFKWRGKPLFVKNRLPNEIELESGTPLSALRDPETEEQRTQKPEWLVVIGICTHLGCVPIANTGDYVGGFYCPCHGSHYDNIGRARKGPAPLNLEVPPYKFVSDTQILVG